MAGYADLGKLVIEIVAKDSEARKKIAGVATECETMAKKTQTAMDKAGAASAGMSATVGRNTAKTQSQLWNLANSASAVGVGFTSLGRLSTRLGSMISMNVTAPLVLAGTSAATTAINFMILKENARISFETLLGSAEAATKMMDELYAYAKTTPFSQETFYNAGKTLLAMGFAADEVKTYLEGMTNAAIATGAGQAGINTLTRAFGKMRSMGRITLEGLNMLTDMGVPAIKILANEYDKTEQEMFDMIHSGKVLSEEALPKLLHGMQEGTKGAAGMTAAYGGLADKMKSGTLTGALDSLHSAWRNMSLELLDAENNFPKLIELVNKVNEVVPKLAKVFAGVTDKVGPALDFLIEKLDQLSKAMDSMSDEELKKIGDAILNIAKAGPAFLILGGALKVIGSSFRGAAGIFRIGHEMEKIKKEGKGSNNVLKTMGANLKKLAFNANNACARILGFGGATQGAVIATQGSTSAIGATAMAFAPLAVVITAVVSTLVALHRHWDKITAIFQNFAERINLEEKLNKIKDAFNGLMDAFRGSGDGSSVLGSILDLLVSIGEKILLALIPAVTILVGVFDAMVSAAAPLIDALSAVIDFVRGFLDVVVGLATFDLSRIIEGWRAMGPAILDFLSSLWDAVEAFAKGFVEGVVNFFFSLKDELVPALAAAKDKIVEFFKSLPGLIKGVLADIGEWFKELPEKIERGIADLPGKLSKLKDKVKEALSGNPVGDKIVEWIETAEGWLADRSPRLNKAFERMKEDAAKVLEDPEYLITLIEGWTEGLVEWSRGKAEELRQQLETWKTAVTDWFVEKKDTFLEGFETWLDNTATWFSELPGKVKDKMSSMGDSVSAWFDEAPNKFKEGFENWWKGVTDWFKSLGEGEDNPGKQAGEIFGKGVEEKVKDPDFIHRLGNALFDLLAAAVLVAGLMVLSLGIVLVEKLWEGLMWAGEKILEFGPKVIDWIFDGIEGAIAGLFEIGEDIVDGIKEGWDAAAADSNSWGETLWNFLVNGIKAIFGIASPAANMNFLGEEMVNGIKEGWDTVVSTAAEWGKGLWDSIQGGFNSIKEGVVGAGKSLADKVKSGVEWGKEKLRGAGQTLATKAKDGVQSAKEKLRGAGETLGTWAKNGVEFVKGKLQAAGQMLGASAKNGVESNKSGARSAGQTLGNFARNGVEAVKSRMRSAGQTLATNVRNGINAGKSTVSSAAKALANGAKTSITSLFDKAKTWASHLVDNLASGLRDGIGAIGSAAGALADAIAKKLKHTVPESGPLTDELEWMPHMVANLTNSLRKSSPQLLDAANELAGDMAETLAIGDMSASRNYASTMQVNTDSNMSGMMGQMMGMMQVMIGKMNPQYQVVLDTGVVAGAMTNRIDRNLGNLNNRRSKGI